MTIPFHEVRFPTSIATGMIAGPICSTTILTLSSGREQRNRNWNRALLEFDVTQAIKTQEQLNTLLKFFYARNGREIGFRFKDWTDYRSPRWISTPGDLGTIPTYLTTDGIHDTIHLAKSYASGGYTRLLTKIVAGSVVLYDNGVPSVDYTVNLNTGVITLGVVTRSTTGHVIKASCEFDVPVRFNVDQMQNTLDEFGIYSWQSIKLVEIRFR